jgi:predicted nuclease of predicted toxin-antitoxin system
MKILVDMNLSPEWIPTLNNAGFEAIHWSGVGSPKAQDVEILEWARRNNWTVFTNDLDFGHILALTQADGPSVLQARAQDLLPENLGEIVVAALRQHREALEAGALIVIDESSLRVRILPIRQIR